MKPKIIILFIACFFTTIKVFSQFNYYEDSFNGGVTCGGYSPDVASGGTGSFTVHIAPGSSIRKAYLLAGEHGMAAPITVTLNTFSYTFNNSNQITNFLSPSFGGPSGVHAIDVTSNINPALANYTLTIPNTAGPTNHFSDFYLYIAYENAALPIVNTVVFLDTLDFGPLLTYNLHLANPVQSYNDIGLSLFTGYICFNNVTDGESITVNSTFIGNIGGPDINSGPCGGPIGSFYYQNYILSGLSDDNPNLAMSGADALSNINSIIPNGSDSLSIIFHHRSNQSDNAIWAVILAYGNSGDTCFIQAGNNIQICSGDSTVLHAVGSGGTGPYSYLWSPPSGLSAANVSNPTAGPANTTTYIVTSTDAVGCAVSDSITVTVNPIFLNSDTAFICQGDSIFLFGNWQTTSGIYNDTLTTLTGCDSIISTNLTINPLPSASIIGDTLICIGTSTVLTATGGTSYLWSTTEITQSITVNPTSGTTYSVTVSDAGCSSTASTNIFLLPLPTANAGNDTTIMIGTSVQLNATGGTIYQWIPITYLNNPNISDPVSTPTADITYIVYVTDMYGCTDSDTIIITVNDAEDIFIPNIFSPNGDGQNDILYVRGKGIKDLDFVIYDRWGEKIFETNTYNDITKGWGGTYKGKKLSSAVFVYYVQGSYFNGDIIDKKGNVTLVR